MKAVTLQSTSDSAPPKKEHTPSAPVPVSPWSVQPQAPTDRLLVQRKVSCACGGGCPSCSRSDDLKVQTKLAISAPGDRFEREADAVADQVMRMPDPILQRQCKGCSDSSGPSPNDEEEPQIQRQANGAGATGEVASDFTSRLGAGAPLDLASRRYFEPRFGHDFSHVRIHNGPEAATAAAGIQARAFTLGRDVVFAAGEHNPGSQSGRRLLAHELTHVVQQQSRVQRDILQRFPSCTSAQDVSVAADHSRALQMLSVAIGKISSYNGTTPAEVHTALATHFHGATSNAFATWININLRMLRAAMSPAYECFTRGILESTWACRNATTLATTFWCVPGFNIRLCPPYFSETDIERSTTLIHEWVHKFGCNFDLDYEHESGYGSNATVTQLLNADPFANLVRDVQ